MNELTLSGIQADAFLIKCIGLFFIISWFVLWLIIVYRGCKIVKFCKKTYRKYRLFFRKLLTPFPKTRIFLIKRFDNSKLSGLHLTLAFIVFISLLLLLFGVTEDFVEQDFIVKIDYWVAKNIALTRTELVVNFFHSITSFGNGKFVFVLFITILIMMIFVYNYFWLLPLIISVGGSMSTAWLSKYFFLRLRPIEALFIEESPSFPSGHATISMSFYAVLFYLWWRQVNSCNIRVLISFLGSSFVLLLAFSRIIIGVHYLTDVIAGLLLGGLWFIIAVSLYEWLNDKSYIQLK